MFNTILLIAIIVIIIFVIYTNDTNDTFVNIPPKTTTIPSKITTIPSKITTIPSKITTNSLIPKDARFIGASSGAASVLTTGGLNIGLQQNQNGNITKNDQFNCACTCNL